MEHDGKNHMGFVRESYPVFQVLKVFEDVDPLWNMAVCQNLVPLVNIKIAGKWMFIPLKMYLYRY